MTAHEKKANKAKDEFIAILVENGWTEDSYGNLKTEKNNRALRIHFKERVARYEVKIAGGSWMRLYSCNVIDLKAEIDDTGKLQMKNWKR